MTTKQFGLIGAAGYIAPRHMQAIRDTQNNLAIAFDISDSVGILDSYFPNADFHTRFESFSSGVDQLRRAGNPIDVMGICSPNDLHAHHMEFALNHGADAICEKPLVLDPDQFEALREVERSSGKRINTILQLRLHDSVVELRKKIQRSLRDNPQKRFKVDLTYLTSRGNWYHSSWKGDLGRSGGIATNIGVHFFDMLAYLFGEISDYKVHIRNDVASAGTLTFEHADVVWFLSIDAAYLPEQTVEAGKRTFRSITVDGEEIEFSEGFTDLHTRSYEKALSGEGFGLDVAETSVRVVHAIRTAPIQALTGEYHPFAKARG